MSHEELTALLYEQGFADGWCLAGDTLTLWFHDQDPPPPLTRPKATDETLTAD